jgi:hypothetical protein
MLHIGTNDVAQSMSVPPTTATNDLLSNVSTWTQTPSNPAVRLLLAQIIGQRLDTTGRVNAFNANLGSLHSSTWDDPASHPRFVVNLVDMNSKVNVPADLSNPTGDPQGLHPRDVGYAKMGNAWFDYLVQNQAIHKCP